MTEHDNEDFMIKYQAQEAVKLFYDLYGGEGNTVPVVYSNNMGTVAKYDPHYANSNKLDTYFIANSFKDNKRSKEALRGLNTFFLDIDAGKALSFIDGQNRYLSEQSVDHFKSRVFPEILTRTITPSYVVETRNGFQVYWIINKTERAILDIKEWIDIQMLIVRGVFSDISDKAVRDVSRLFRHPGSTWFKTTKNIDCNGEKIDPFECRIVFSSRKMYSLDKLRMAFPASKINVPEATQRTIETSTYILSRKHEAMRRAILESKLDYFSEWILPENVASQLKDRKNFNDYIKKNISIQSFFSLPSNHFQCVFHSDKEPSAYILFPNKDYEQYSYYCHSEGCPTHGRALSIVDIISNIRKCDFNESLDFLAKCFGVAVKPYAIRKSYREVVKERSILLRKLKTRVRNKKFLERVDIERVHSVFNKLIRETAQLSGKTERVDLLYIPCAKRLFEKMTGADCRQMYLATKFLAYIGFIKPISDYEINTNVLNKTIKNLIKEQRQIYGEDKSMQFYKIEVWPDLKEAEKKIQDRIDRWIEGGLEIKKITVESVARIYGEKTAGQLFPKCF